MESFYTGVLLHLLWLSQQDLHLLLQFPTKYLHTTARLFFSFFLKVKRAKN